MLRSGCHRAPIVNRRGVRTPIGVVTLRVRLIATPIIACPVGAAHCELAPEFDPILRAATVTIMVMFLDALVVAPLFGHTYAMCAGASSRHGCPSLRSSQPPRPPVSWHTPSATPASGSSLANSRFGPEADVGQVNDSSGKGAPERCVIWGRNCGRLSGAAVMGLASGEDADRRTATARVRSPRGVSVAPKLLTRGVEGDRMFRLLGKELDRGETTKSLRRCPSPLRRLWPAPTGGGSGPA
jgi:hypothetical protein